MPIPEKFNQTMAIIRLVEALGRVKRATIHIGGEPESDTTHSMMLALTALEIYDTSISGVDFWGTTRVLMFALVHDLPEVYAGDVNTLVPLDKEAAGAKETAEEEATNRIAEEVDWLASWIREYNRQDCLESRLVHILDKALPKALRVVAGPGPLDSKVPIETLKRLHKDQGARLRAEAPDPTLALAHEFFDSASAACEDVWAKGQP